ncbi:hypothetical protein F5148DRAFT_151816 [Russula earlei]|uniref:Uncharacterized protein n=1 Tax=Russula earlei TaxID=71964 RepID=A0ACC0U6K0_9AGAM|nr:hypothetical protein F5148DRAFT_151816 [Russula earlei]
MSHLTPPTLLVWSLLTSLLGCLLLYHLWCFDRFRCIRWNQGPQGTFKRVMTYSYLLSVPSIMTYAIGFSIIKYSEGYITFPGFGVIPNPYQLWTPAHRSAILPLYMCMAVAWSCEMVTHLEELCFWLFVVNARPTQKDWFSSLYFKTWVVGSAAAIFCVPFVTLFHRSDPLKCEAYTLLAGSLGSLFLTLSFIPVLFLFQPFLRGLREEGVDMNTIIRLTKFHELNTIRVFFRLLFALPLLVLSIDGVRHHHTINEKLFDTEFLAMLSGFGMVVSSGITVMIFFPRSIENEILARDMGLRSRGLFGSRNHLISVSQEQELYGTYDPEDMPVESKPTSSSPPPQYHHSVNVPSPMQLREGSHTPLPLVHPATLPTELVRLAPNRRPASPERMPYPAAKPCLHYAERLNNPATKTSLLRQNFRSPIEFGRRSRW